MRGICFVRVTMSMVTLPTTTIGLRGIIPILLPLQKATTSLFSGF
jgi:hypothetical protein